MAGQFELTRYPLAAAKNTGFSPWGRRRRLLQLFALTTLCVFILFFAKFRACPEPVGEVGIFAGSSAWLAHEIQRHRRADKILQCRLIDLVAFMDVDGAPHIPFEARVE
jgi:hypothetical protein